MKLPNSLLNLWTIVCTAGEAWIDDKAPRIGAALAFYTVLSLSPLLVIVLAIAGLVFGEEAARGELANQIRGLIGDQGAKVLEQVLANSNKPKSGTLAIIVGVATLIFGASGVFGELQEAMNDIWKVRPRKGRAIIAFIKTRFLSFGMVLGIGFLLLVSLTLTTLMAILGRYLSGQVPEAAGMLLVLNYLVTFFMEATLFGMIFKVLPDAKLAWRDVAFGAGFTAVLFNIGKYLIGLYITYTGTGSSFGAAGSIIALVVWVYYSAQILLFGAELTKVVADRAGRRIAPSKGAEAIPGADTPVVDRALKTV